MNKENKKTRNLIPVIKKQDPPVRLNMTFEEAIKKSLNTRLILKTSAKKSKNNSM